MILIHLPDKKLTVVILSESDLHDCLTIGTMDFSFDLTIQKLLVFLLTASLHVCLQLYRYMTLNASLEPGSLLRCRYLCALLVVHLCRASDNHILLWPRVSRRPSLVHRRNLCTHFRRDLNVHENPPLY